MSIVIHKQSGAIVVAGNTIIGSLDETVFAESSLGQKATRMHSTGGWVIYSKIQSEGVGLVLRFLDGKLAEVNLAFANPDSDWNSWSEAKEESAKSVHDNWLASQLGEPPYIFNWGNVESLQDQRAGCSLILIRYKKAPGKAVMR